MLRFEWMSSAERFLQRRGEEDLADLYHENSKLSADLANQQAQRTPITPFELHVTSRGFRQHRGVPRVELPEALSSREALQDVMLRRRSKRDLDRPLGLAELGTVLRQALGPTAIVHNVDYGVSQVLRAWPSAGGLYPIDTYVVAQRVEGLLPGMYHYNVMTSELEQLPGRSPRDVLRQGFFWQDFIVNAAVVLLFVAAFERTKVKYGQRGYRLVLLDAGHAAQSALLAAEQMRLSAVAVAGFDDDVLAEALGLDGVSEAVVHSIALGGAHE